MSLIELLFLSLFSISCSVHPSKPCVTSPYSSAAPTPQSVAVAQGAEHQLPLGLDLGKMGPQQLSLLAIGSGVGR